MSFACSDQPELLDASSEPDAGRDASVVIRPSPVAAPGLPRMTCPSGWTEELLADAPEVRICDPFGGPRMRCSGAAAHFPGEPGCRSLGTPCPSDGLPSDVPADAVFVLAGSAGGDGTRGLPFATINEALAVVLPGGTIAVGVGRYDETVFIRDLPITVRGACAEDVVLTPDRTALSVADQDVSISNMTLAGCFTGLTVRGATAHVRDVLIDGCGTGAHTFSDGGLDMRDVVIRGASNAGISTGGGVLHLERFAMEDVGDIALSVSDATLTAIDGVIDGLDDDGEALATLFGESVVSFTRVAVRSTAFGQVLVDGAARLTLTDVDIRASGLAPFSRFGFAALNGGTLEMTRVHLAGAPAFAIGVGDPGTTLRLSDSVIGEMHPPDPRRDGHAIEVDEAGTAQIERVWIERALGIGILASGPGANVTVDDVVVRNTRSDGDGAFGRALQVQLGARVVSNRTRFTANHEATAVVATPGSSWVGTDVTIEDSAERSCAPACPPGGIGISVFQSASARLERFRVHRSALIGVQVAFDGSLELIDGEVAECPIGANVQVPGYDIERLRQRVIYRDNGINLDATELTIPNPVAPSG